MTNLCLDILAGFGSDHCIYIDVDATRNVFALSLVVFKKWRHSWQSVRLQKWSKRKRTVHRDQEDGLRSMSLSLQLLRPACT